MKKTKIKKNINIIILVLDLQKKIKHAPKVARIIFFV